MRKLFLAAAALSFALVFIACGGETETGGAAANSDGANAAVASKGAAKVSTTPAPPPAPEAASPAQTAGARRISIDEALPLVEKGEAVFVDVRLPNEYHVSHIRGAVNVPLAEVTANLSKLPKDKLIVTYCA